MIQVFDAQGRALTATSALAWSGLTGAPRDNAALEAELEALEAAIALRALDSDLDTHTARTDNPHAVTAAQVGAYSTSAIDALIAGIEADLAAGLAGKSDTGHGHVISDITGLQTALDGKAATSHTHAISAITGLQDELDALQPLAANLTELAALADGDDGEVLTLVGGAYAWATPAAGGAEDLADLGDVTITAAASGDFLRHNGTAWVDSTIQAGDLPSHTHAAGDITSGVLAAARGGIGSGLTSGAIPYFDGAAAADSPLTRISSTQVRVAQTLSFPSGAFLSDLGYLNAIHLSSPTYVQLQAPIGTGVCTVYSAGMAAHAGGSAFIPSAPLHARKASGAQIIGDHSSGNQFSLQADASGYFGIAATGQRMRHYRSGDATKYFEFITGPSANELNSAGNALWLKYAGNNRIACGSTGCVLYGNLAFFGGTAVAQHALLSDPTGTSALETWAAAINDLLIGYGLMAAS